MTNVLIIILIAFISFFIIFYDSFQVNSHYPYLKGYQMSAWKSFESISYSNKLTMIVHFEELFYKNVDIKFSKARRFSEITFIRYAQIQIDWKPNNLISVRASKSVKVTYT
jgi:hypothetical protein